MSRIRSYYYYLREFIIDWGTEFIALFLLGLGLFGYFRGSNLYVPIFTEVIGIGLAVLLIDLSNKLLTRRSEKNRLILQMGSPSTEFAREAVRQLRAKGWMVDGTLRNKHFRAANLESANLQQADLQYANLEVANLKNAQLSFADLSHSRMEGADLEGAFLIQANLESALLPGAILTKANLYQSNFAYASLNNTDLRKAILRGANLLAADLRDARLNDWLMTGLGTPDGQPIMGSKADLTGANLSYANLKGASVTNDQLSKAESLEGATMPDGTIYNPETFGEWQEEHE